jgi:transposase
MDEITEEPGALTERVAALDIGKATLTVCIRVPHEDKPGARRQEVRTCATLTPALPELRDWLICQGVTLVVMEATSACWKPPFCLLEDDIECWVVDPRDARNVPGRPKTDKLDAVWLCKLAERGMLRASFIPPRPQRQLRDLTRYRRTLTRERTREKQRAEKLPGDAQIKLPVVISDIFGASGRAMLDALIAGQRNPHALAALAYRNRRAKTSVLQEALTGHFTDHHAYMPGMMLARIDALTTQIDTLTTATGAASAPFAAQVAQLDETRDRHHRRPGPARRDRHRHVPLPHPRPPGVLGQVRAPGPPVRRPQQGRLRRPGQPLARRHRRRGRRRRRPHQDLPGLPLQADRQPPRQATRPGRPSATPSSPSSGTCCPTPPPTSPTWAPTGTTPGPATPQTPAHRRTRTALR